MNKVIIFIGILMFITDLSALSDDCITGYACSLDSLKEQETKTIEKNQNDKNIVNNAEKIKELEKNEKNDNYKKYAKPQYTEIFTKFDFLK